MKTIVERYMEGQKITIIEMNDAMSCAAADRQDIHKYTGMTLEDFEEYINHTEKLQEILKRYSK